MTTLSDALKKANPNQYSARRISELTLEDHTAMVQAIEQKLKAHGFNVVVHSLPFEA